ncbi:MAG TPA: iron dependent repressor, metal binding and dimerization domain protein [Rhabdochlamydiaceae bacterium]|nr:iron dependent repressor, metal binding and dimerization domain protein [Rhabdochlamydiaceae bacterium]
MENRAIPFRETRRIHRVCESAEDYTELIADLIKIQEQVRVCDVARKMGISHVTVLKTIKRLIRDGYVTKNRNFLELTLKGKETAVFSQKRHLILSAFLLKLGVPKEVVATDVEGIEHHVSAKTLQAIEDHLEQLK